ncbi:MAG TPA: Flp pilus assembly protein CpaB [Actinomycetes bacterium]
MQNRLLAIMVAIVLAVVSAMALVVYANSADRRALSEQAPVPVYVASSKIEQGESFEQASGKIRIASIPRKALAENAVRALSQISGRVAAVDILPGEQLLLGRWVSREEVEGQNLLNVQPTFQAVSIQVDATRQVSGFITPGNRVNIYATLTGAGGVKFSRLLLADIKVLAVGATALPGGAKRPGSAQGSLSTVTLEVKDGQVERVVFAAESGSLYLSLVAPGAKPAPPRAGSNIGNLFG